MAKKTAKTEENKLSLVVDFSGFVELPEGVTAEKRAEEIKAKIKTLKVESIEDKANYEQGRELLTQLVKLRTTIEKVRKEKNGPVTDAKKRIDDTAKALAALFQPCESDLEKEVRKYEGWVEENKNFRANQLKARQEYLINNGFPFNGEHFICIIEGETICGIAPKQISMSDDAEWDALLKEHINPAIEKWTAFKAEETRLFNEFKKNHQAGAGTSIPNTDAVKEKHPIYVPLGTDSIPEIKESFKYDDSNTGVVADIGHVYEAIEVTTILKKVLTNFKALQKGPSTQTMQLEAIIDAEIKNL